MTSCRADGVNKGKVFQQTLRQTQTPFTQIHNARMYSETSLQLSPPESTPSLIAHTGWCKRLMNCISKGRLFLQSTRLCDLHWPMFDLIEIIWLQSGQGSKWLSVWVLCSSWAHACLWLGSEDPTIMAWGLANEARCIGDFSGSKLQVHDLRFSSSASRTCLAVSGHQASWI